MQIDTRRNIIGPIKKLIADGELYIRPEDRKIAPTKQYLPAIDFILTRVKQYQLCHWWHDLWFPYYRIIPSPCMECWKVVVRPRDIEELFKLYRLQLGLEEYDCKCGIERRDYVRGLYGGYFYNKSLEDGEKCWKDVRREVSSFISPDVPVILKRSCTEYEIDSHLGPGFGPSDKWELQKETIIGRLPQLELEEVLNNSYDLTPVAGIQSEEMLAEIIDCWLRWAMKFGRYQEDDTYLNYHAGEPYYPKVVTYHDELET